LGHFINEVKALGCKIAIDDFGSGYSNFEHIIKMNVDYLKIDASLIKNIAIDDNSYKVTQTIVDFAKKLNLKTIAEYVENEEIFKITKSMGVDFSQGYYFSPPISSPELESC
jgi:EAL domain-containing protein (putative c-di-GMP-specific phosphodiesterase class I)